MKDTTLHKLLVGATPATNSNISPFVAKTMARIENIPVQRQRRWSIAGLRLSRPQLVAWAMALIVMISAIGFSGYAYAIGSNPVSLLERIIVGHKVEVKYQGRKFEYGTAQTYSDLAITAYAELNTIEGLAFAAGNAGAIPHNSLEYLGLPSGYADKYPYIFPSLGVITGVNDDSITIHQMYMLGDKVSPSHDLDVSTTIARNAELEYFADGKKSAISSADIGRVVQLRQSYTLKHTIGQAGTPPVVTRNLVFALHHKIADFKEGDRTTAAPTKSQDDRLSGLIEKNFGSCYTAKYD